MTITITESVGLTTGTGRRYRARLIEGERWGSSGWYGQEMLTRDGPHVWPVGTQVYIDHPGVTEQHDRPERSIRDLAGKITSTPVYETDGLYADIEFYPHVAPIIEDRRMRCAPQPVLEGARSVRRRPSDGKAHHREVVPLARVARLTDFDGGTLALEIVGRGPPDYLPPGAGTVAGRGR